MKDLKMEVPLPKRLCLKIDNCTRENKKRFMFAHLECLVECGVFVEAVVGFLPVFNTHEDTDQSLRTTSERLISTNTITLSNIHTEIESCYSKHAEVEHMEHLISCSKLRGNENCSTNAQNFS